MLELVLVRHGETFDNRRRVLQGQSPTLGRLTPLGKEQARLAGLALADEPFDVALCSTLERAVLTLALMLAQRPDDRALPLEFHEGLRELDLGTLEGAPRDVWFEQAGDADQTRFRPPGGESWHDLQRRIGAFFRERILPREGRVLVVAHGGVNGSFLTTLLGLPPAMGGFSPVGPLKQRNGSINRIRLEGGRPTHIHADDVRHLAPLGGPSDAGFFWTGDDWRPA